MLKIYNAYSYVSIDGAEWRKVGSDGYRVSDEELDEVLLFENLSFNKAYKYLCEKNLDGVWLDETLFRHKPIIRIGYSDVWEPVSYKAFNTLSYKLKYKEKSYVTLDWIMRHLSADQCIQYMKERGMTACPILKGE